MEMNANLDLATFYAAKLNVAELTKLHELIADKLDMIYERHSADIRSAIESAINDGLEIEIWSEHDGQIKIASKNQLHVFINLKE